MTQPLDLDAIEARAQAATPGPWTVSEDYDDILDAEGGQLASYWMEVDGQFIAHAREDVPAMAAEIRRLRAQLNAVTTLCDEQEMAAHLFEFPTPEWITAVRRAVEDATEETHVVADDSDGPEHVDDCPGCTAAHPTT